MALRWNYINQIIKKMTITKNNFIQSLFKSLSAEQYVLLKWTGEDLSQLAETSDLDILITKAVKEKIAFFLQESTVLSKVEKEEFVGVTHYYLYFKNGDFLQVDLLNKFVRKDLIYLTTSEVFENSITIKGIKTYPAYLFFEHTLLFNLLNGSGLSEKYFLHFNKLTQQEQFYILDKFNSKYHTCYKNLANTTRFSATHKIAVTTYLKSLADNSFFNKLKNTLAYVKGICSKISQKRGHIITFSGVDGAGKSTIINDIGYLLGGKYRKKIVVLRHRPSLLPIISAWKYGKKKAEQKSVERLPRQGHNNSSVSSYLRFSYYYIDYLLGQFYIWAKYLVRGYIVVYDRYYFDFIIDGKRSNINMSATLPKFLYAFVAKPDLNFFLYADAATIIKRKQELSSSVITQLTQKYLSLFKDFSKNRKGKYIHIENLNKKNTLQTILHHYLKIA